jgi:hypothetical protein
MDAANSAKNHKGVAQSRNAPERESQPVVFRHEVHTGVDRDSGLMHWMVVTAANAYTSPRLMGS